MTNTSQVLSSSSFEHLLCVLEIIYVVHPIFDVVAVPYLLYHYSGFGVGCSATLSGTSNYTFYSIHLRYYEMNLFKMSK